MCDDKMIINAIEELSRGSDFMFWASLKQSVFESSLFSILPNGSALKAQMRNLHLYEIRGVADKLNNTLHITSDVFAGKTRVMEAEISIDDIREDPDSFCDIIDRANRLALDYLDKSYSSFINQSVVPTGMKLDLDDQIEVNLYIKAMSDAANESLENGTALSDNDIIQAQEKVEIKKFTISGADFDDEIKITLLKYILAYISGVAKDELFTIELTYTTTNVIGEPLEGKTILESTGAFNIVKMRGAFSYVGNTVICEPTMKWFYCNEGEEETIDERYMNEIVVEHVYRMINYLLKIKDIVAPIEIKVKAGLKGEEDFWDYV